MISKEEAISKGVRRIYGLTGLRAEDAIAAGNAIAEKITVAEKLKGDALDKAVKTLKKEVDEAEAMSAPVRTKLRERVNAMAKSVIEENKKKAAATLEVVKAEAVKAATAAKAASTACLVLKIDQLQADAKLGKAVMEAAQKVADGTVIVGVSVTADKAMLMVSVPKPLQSKVKAGDVVKAVMPTLGGKGGGKPDFAQGQGSNVAAVGDAIAQATYVHTLSAVVNCFLHFFLQYLLELF